MVSPESVNVTTPDDGMAPDKMEITTRVRVEFSVRKDKPDESAMRADVEEKKLAGKSMVIVLPTEHAPPGLT